MKWKKKNKRNKADLWKHRIIYYFIKLIIVDQDKRDSVHLHDLHWSGLVISNFSDSGVKSDRRRK